MAIYNDHKNIPGNPSTAKTSKIKLRKEASFNSLKIFSVNDWTFWLENGYIVVKNAVTKQQAMKTASFLWEFEEKDSKDPSTWYSLPRAEMKMKELA